MNTRSLISIALIVGFSAIAVFGAFAMGQTAGEQNACIAATANGLECVAPSNLASIASMYLGAFGTFSSAFFSALSLLILFVTGFSILSDKGSGGGSSRLFSFLSYISDISRSTSTQGTLAWVAIHENSPSRR